MLRLAEEPSSGIECDVGKDGAGISDNANFPTSDINLSEGSKQRAYAPTGSRLGIYAIEIRKTEGRPATRI